MISANQAEDAVIEGEITPDANPDGFDAIEAAPSQPPEPAASSEPVQAAVAQNLAGEVMASDYSAPPQLEIDELDETKSLVLFS